YVRHSGARWYRTRCVNAGWAQGSRPRNYAGGNAQQAAGELGAATVGNGQSGQPQRHRPVEPLAGYWRGRWSGCEHGNVRLDARADCRSSKGVRLQHWRPETAATQDNGLARNTRSEHGATADNWASARPSAAT